MARWIRIALPLLLWVSGETFAMEVFQFVDPSGTVHFTNVPTDPRYRLLPPERRAPSPIGGSYRQRLETIIDREAGDQGIEPALVRAVIHAESNFDAGAISHAGALGLMQLMPDTVADLRLGDPFDPEENIRGGARHLRYLLRLFNGELPLALAAYHAGAGTVLKYGRIPPIQETRLYVGKVLRLYQKYAARSVPSRKVYQGKRSNGVILYTNRPEQYPRIVFSKFKE